MPPDVAEPGPTDWLASLTGQRYQQAHALLLASGGDGPAAELAALAEIQTLTRDKAYTKALGRLNGLESPVELLDWERLARDLEAFEKAEEALTKRRVEAAETALPPVEGCLLAAERATLVGTVRIFDNRFADARVAFEEALELDPKHHRALTNLGNLALEEDRVDDAIDAYQRALELNEDFANAHHNLGVAYRRKGEIGRSVRALKRAQRSMQQQQREQARESMARYSRVRGGRLLRWVGWAALALLGLWLLQQRGVL